MAVGDDEAVVLLHGLARTENSMTEMEEALAEEGYAVFNIAYPSTDYPIEELGLRVRGEITAKTEPFETVHFVTHSMGGIVLRQMLAVAPFDKTGRVVMLSPPNQGSEVVDKLGEWRIFEWINGPAGGQLGTETESLVNRLPPVDFELGVITGDRSINWILSLLIPGSDDGKVSVDHARVEGMTDFRVVHATHPFIMKNAEVIGLVRRFLASGSFAGSPDLADFSSDGCSLFPDRSLISEADWCACCLEHDIAYWQGGTAEERLLADRALRDCVLEKTGNAELAELMYTGVRFGGGPLFPTWYRWGYGWEYGRGYEPLNDEEKALVEEKLAAWYADSADSPCSQADGGRPGLDPE